ncbi:[FeFe] hydrogenase H-cluster maturation GTPase HydF [Anaerophilus nitritogenes]|uniref:[FeFe] hydrogenase H-cluster maturation GTPase HydF n=1 Tax=Anaerophilus nitritogenes TaxID=2498136 RepID=UPI00101CC93A
MQETPRGNRLHISLFGKRNVGKSSLINSFTNQDIALVSNVAGTTTDPVYKSMEILPIGPVVLIDTAGIDDAGALGRLRIQKTYEVLRKTEVALLIFTKEITSFEKDMIQRMKEKNIPLIGVINKIDEEDIDKDTLEEWEKRYDIPFVKVSAKIKYGIENLKEAIIKVAHLNKHEKVIVGDLIDPGDFVVLVTPIDKAAPKGRLILPQQQTIRDIIDHGGVAIVTRDTYLTKTLKDIGKKTKMVITDSQAFKKVDELTPIDIPLTSFSILFARYKGDLETLVLGASKIKNLQKGSKVLICEGCTHHRQKGDIGKDKIPKWIENMAGENLSFEWISGISYPDEEDIKKYDLIVHCGGCMLNPKEMEFRIQKADEYNIPIVNYGVLIGLATGVLNRALDIFPNIKEKLK